VVNEWQKKTITIPMYIIVGSTCAFTAITSFHANIIEKHSAAKLQKKYSTLSHEAGTKYTKIKKYNYLNLPLCSLWFLGVFVFESLLPKKQRFYL